jgi:hypothetical protein
MLPEDEKGTFLRDFLLKDYELKVQALTSHNQRLLTRSNFFLTIDAGLFALSATERSYAVLVIIAGMVVSLAWFIFATMDNYQRDLWRG